MHAIDHDFHHHRHPVVASAPAIDVNVRVQTDHSGNAVAACTIVGHHHKVKTGDPPDTCDIIFTETWGSPYRLVFTINTADSPDLSLMPQIQDTFDARRGRPFSEASDPCGTPVNPGGDQVEPAVSNSTLDTTDPLVGFYVVYHNDPPVHTNANPASDRYRYYRIRLVDPGSGREFCVDPIIDNGGGNPKPW